ncbi:hypothetical protein RM545_17165 [Zunongwangia sp. F260]|uniref:Uncharacterized protein n=1 Tax=Autumnicola lenta TaxID=3075593 RepID=A0ABU3CPY7_9FLAO|nr:hypothetical protein [Zunongwangia sp. F260]MDT0648425.1 hypothetical protein [Zunongwangia sp. F260]
MKITITLLALLISFGSFSQKYPDSFPNGGSIGGHTWTIKDYIDNAKKDSIRAVENYKTALSQAEYLKPKEQPKELKEKGWFAKNIVDTKEDQRKKNKELKEQQEKYDLKIQEINEDFKSRIEEIQKYRDDWVRYRRAEAIAKAEAKRERELEAEKKRIQDEKDAKIAQEKAEKEQKQREEEWKAMPTNPDYKQWKAKYEKALALAQANVDKCEAIIKKYTFRNAFGEKLYDSSDFSEAHKKVFNQNLELLGKHNNEIGNLENEKTYYYYWNEAASIEKSTTSYRLSSYYNNKSKVY